MTSIRPYAGALLVVSGGAVGGFAWRHYDSKRNESADGLHPQNFSAYTIAAREPVSRTSSIFTLHAQDHTGHHDLKHVWQRGVWSVEVKQPQLQIARAYTPLPPSPSAVPEPAVTTSPSSTSSQATPAAANKDDDDAHSSRAIRLLIRREPSGEVSNYLHRLPVSSTVELRGPHVEFEVPHDTTDVLFIAGGTGIAPALQVAHALMTRESNDARIRILWANRLREECVGGKSDSGARGHSNSGNGGWKSWIGLGQKPKSEDFMSAQEQEGKEGAIVQELEALKKHVGADGRLRVEYYVDEEGSFIRPAHVSKHLSETPHGKQGTQLIMISGPDGFLDHWSGRKVWAEQGEVQGPLRGALSKMDLKGWKVWKL
ncbi:uncharacterized protein J3D65DRAFT_645292 [Phyllosticta citribraziliensis]|uniref:FAD-binding FR-type domain-containing protein n=1 Tax=Phyllosticta citribraziliensis TaxID=989973 RepID=A0ABR1LXU9_9PEZI